MKKLLLIFCCIGNIAFAQQQKIDSLLLLYKSAKNDSVKLELLKTIIIKTRKTKLPEKKQLILEAVKLSEKNKNTQSQAIFNRELGIYYKNIGELDSAINTHKISEKAFLKINDSANYYANKSSIANIYKRQGKFKKATEYFIKSIHFFNKNHPKKALITQLNLSSLYFNNKEYAKATHLLRNIAEHPISKKNTNLLRIIYNNLLGNYIKTKQLDSALYFGKKAEAILKKSPKTQSLANLQNNLGALYEEKNQNKQALNYFKEALKNYKAVNNFEGIVKATGNIGNIYTKLQQYTLAEKLLLQSEKMLQKTKNIYSVENNYEKLYTLYNQQKNYKKALEYSDKIHRIKDSIFSIEKLKEVKEIEVKYEVANNKLKAETAEKDKAFAEVKAVKNKTYLFYTLFFVGLLILLFTFYIFRLRQHKRTALIQQELKASQKQLALEKQYQHSELRSLKAQMNPHFMFNAMNSIQNLVLKGDKQNAYDYLTKLAQLIRENLNLSEKSFVYFDEELSLLEKYLELEKLRFKDDFSYKINGAETIGDVKIPSMIIQPFVENAIKHGLLHKTNGNKQVTIDFLQEKKVFTCIVFDNGIGIEASKKINEQNQIKAKSFSTNAIKERLDLLKEYYGLSIGYEYVNVNEGTKVILKIPYLKDDE